MNKEVCSQSCAAHFLQISSSDFCHEPVVMKSRQIHFCLIFGNQFCQLIAHCRTDAEAVTGEPAGQDHAGNFFHRAQDRYQVHAFVFFPGLGPDDFGFGQI